MLIPASVDIRGPAPARRGAAGRAARGVAAEARAACPACAAPAGPPGRNRGAGTARAERPAQGQHLVGEDRGEVAEERGQRIVLGHHQVAVAELDGELPGRHAGPGGRAVAADVVGHGLGLVDAPPAHQPRAPGQVGVGRSRRGRPRAPPPGPRRTPGRRPRRPRARCAGTAPPRRRRRRPRRSCRRRAPGGRGPRASSCACGPATCPRCRSRPAAARSAGPWVRISFGATEPTPGSSRWRRAAATKPGERKQSGCTNSTASPSTDLTRQVHRARERVALVQAHAAHPVLGRHLGRGVLGRVVQHHHLHVVLGQRGGQRMAQQLGLAGGDDRDSDLHRGATLSYTAQVCSAARRHE